MGDQIHHARVATEKRQAAIDELQKERYTVVDDLTLKAVEQAAEAAAAGDDRHFHVSPRTAHSQRVSWVRERFPDIAVDFEVLWGVYGDLGYDGLNGNRARKGVEAMERILSEISRQTGIRFGEAG